MQIFTVYSIELFVTPNTIDHMRKICLRHELKGVSQSSFSL